MKEVKVNVCTGFGMLPVATTEFNQAAVLPLAIQYAKACEEHSGIEVRRKFIRALKEVAQLKLGNCSIDISSVLGNDMLEIMQNNAKEDKMYQIPLGSIEVREIYLFDGPSKTIQVMYVFKDLRTTDDNFRRFLRGDRYELLEMDSDRVGSTHFFANGYSPVGFSVAW